MPRLSTLFFLLPIVIAFSACTASDEDCSTDTNCSDYNSQYKAQAAYDANPLCRGDLDADNDGIACEDWASYYQDISSGGGSNGGGGTACPTTSACGCSGKNKSACQGDSCCKWTTGQGCGCR